MHTCMRASRPVGHAYSCIAVCGTGERGGPRWTRSDTSSDPIGSLWIEPVVFPRFFKRRVVSIVIAATASRQAPWRVEMCHVTAFFRSDRKKEELNRIWQLRIFTGIFGQQDLTALNEDWEEQYKWNWETDSQLNGIVASIALSVLLFEHFGFTEFLVLRTLKPRYSYLQSMWIHF